MPIWGFHRHRWVEVHREHTERTSQTIDPTSIIKGAPKEGYKVVSKVTIISGRCENEGRGKWRQHILEGHLPISG